MVWTGQTWDRRRYGKLESFADWVNGQEGDMGKE